MPGSPSRALRVGLVLRDNLVEERVFADPAPITFGHALRCRLSLPVDGVPREHALFVRDHGRWLLRVTAAMAGQVVQGGRTITALQAGACEDGVWSIPIEAGARGRLTLGEATILFHEIAAPPVAPRPVLPAALRGTLGDRIDPRLAVIVGGSLVVHLAIGAWAWATDVELPSPLAAAHATYRQDTYAITLPDDPVADSALPAPTLPGIATPAVPTQTPPRIVPRLDRPDRSPALATGRDAERFAQILTGDPTAASPGGPGEMAGRLPGADLDDQLDDLRDHQRTVRVGNDDSGFRNRAREGLGDGPDLRLGRPTLAAQRPREETQPARIDLRPIPIPGEPLLSSDGVLAKIQHAYLPGLQRCYRKGLATDATLRGKVTVRFTVDARGQVSDPSARGLTTEVDACITGQMASWRFAIPRDGDGDPTERDFALALALVPGQ